MTTYGLGPALFLTPAERLLRGKGVDSAVGAGRVEDWIALDRGVFWGTAAAVHGWRYRHRRIRVGFRWFDGLEISDWDRAPYWQESGRGGVGAPSWSPLPTESEVALCLAHADVRVRAAALARAESGALPASVLPLVLIRCADTDERVRHLARAVFGRTLAGADGALLRQLAPLAALVGMRRRFGTWGREAVLGPLGGLPGEALAQLLSSSDREARTGGLYAGAAYGRLDVMRALAIAEGDPDNGVRMHAVRAVMSVALAPGRQADLDAVRPRVVAQLHTDSSYEVRRETFTTAVETGFFRARDLAVLAVTHRDRYIRRRSCAAVLAGPDGNALLDGLFSARDPTVRTAAVERLRSAGLGGELVRHLADPSPAVRAAVCRELRAAGDDPRTHYRALCADPAAVTPAAAIGLAEQRCPDDVTLLKTLTRHHRPTVRARALSALTILDDLPDNAQPPPAPTPLQNRTWHPGCPS